MKAKLISYSISLVITIIFFLIIIRPGGLFSLIGYTISLLIFPQNSKESIRYENLIIYTFDVLCALGVFFLIYKLLINKIKVKFGEK